MKWRSPPRPCELAYLNLQSYRWVSVVHPSPTDERRASGWRNATTLQIGVGSRIVSLITNRAGTSVFWHSSPGSPGLHRLFDLGDKTFCLGCQLPLPFVLIPFTLTKELIRDVHGGQDCDLDRVDTGAALGDLPHAGVDEASQFLKPGFVTFRPDSETLAENLNRGSH